MPVGGRYQTSARLGYRVSCRTRDMVHPWYTAVTSSYPSTLLEPRLTAVASQARGWKRECASDALRWCAGDAACIALDLLESSDPSCRALVVMRSLRRPVAQRKLRCSKAYNVFNNERNDTFLVRDDCSLFKVLSPRSRWSVEPSLAKLCALLCPTRQPTCPIFLA